MVSSILFVVSPHFDDAAFSCGAALATHPRSIVCTVFAGAPAMPLSTSWDRRAGFLHSDAALQARQREDDRALDVLGAQPRRLPFLDSQYGASPSCEAVERALGDTWQSCGRPTVLAPLGLFHSDHALASDACCALFVQEAMPDLILYEDALYRRMRHVADERREALARRGLRLELETAGPLLDAQRNAGAAARKWRSVRAYRSQLRALEDAHPNDLVEPERYWRLSFDRKAGRLRGTRR
ncbi:PIG-L family deacetylase [Trinickia symbiotica]|uniref:PIG-L family deacetylase n=1 Tax=Trinickia symbiotica TaxID=863227 RepID=A0A2T3Y122_9BURK|nr:PIG-L family deacetylase [Trinickia symbiotica]PTB22459.1 PIG-L family deacetylase [Trinickia symbiotica]